MDASALVKRIDDLLPQTQCGQCGYEGCRPYARAIAGGEEDINRCPPGGESGIKALAEVTGEAPKPLDESRGVHHEPPLVAVIDEPACIGCTRCIQACPVDAIVGAAKRMHTVIEEECTGCELCLPPCPVDCIDLVPAPARARENASQQRARAHHARRRYEARNRRLREKEQQAAERRRAHSAGAHQDAGDADDQAVIAAAVARARSRRGGRPSGRANGISKAIERARAQRRAAHGDPREQG